MARLLTVLVVMGFICVGPSSAQSGVPREIDKNARYLFYISGYIVAEGNTRPASRDLAFMSTKRFWSRSRSRALLL